MEVYLLALFSFLAGLVDSMSGGGGLIQLPALLALQPQLPMVNALAINKAASICGTSTASVNYLRKIRIDWRLAIPCAIAAFAFAGLGAFSIDQFRDINLRPLVLVILIAVLAYTLKAKSFGQENKETPTSIKKSLTATALIATPIGFYDGFFGPGTGGFFTFCFVRFIKMDFLKATALSKLLNFTTNLAAITYFVSHGHVLFHLALPMAAANMAGAFTGSHLAMKRGNSFVRKVFIVVSSLLLLKIAFDWLKN